MSSSNTLEITVDGIDVTKFTQSIPSLAFSTGDYGDFSTIGSVSIEGDNTNQFWNTLNSNSILYNRDYKNWMVNITELTTNTLVWQGRISDVEITGDGKTASITLSSRMQEFLDINVGLYVYELATPAEIAADMLTLWGVPYDNASFEKSKSIQAAGGVFITASVSYEHNLTLINALKMLADIGVARMYTWKNKTYYTAYDFLADEPDTVQVPLSEIWKIDSVNSQRLYEVAGYNIKTVSATISDGDTSSESNLKTLDLSAGKPFQLHGLTGADHIGVSYMHLASKLYSTVSIKVSKSIGFVFRPGIKILLPANNIIDTDMAFEILSIDNSSKLSTSMVLRSI